MGLFTILAVGISLLTGALSYVAAKNAQKDAKKAADAMAGVLVNKESNIEPIPVIYGQRRVGGVRVFVHAQGGKKNEYLYLALVLCEGEVESIYDIEIDDRPITDSRYAGLIATQTFTGTDGQAASSILSATSKWGSQHKLSGVAYIAMRLKWDQDVFSGIPDITAIVKGKKVYDPRSPSSPNAWSDNPALCIRDYLTNNRYGKGLPSSAINDLKFIAAANDCDNFQVTPYSGGPSNLKIFQTNAVLDTGEELFRNVERLLLGCRGFLPYSQGKYELVIDQATSSVMTIDQSKIIGGISIKSEEKKDKFNRVIVKFPNPQTDWQPDQAIWPDAGSSEETQFLQEDGGTLLIDETDVETITSFYAARDFARVLCLRSRNALRCSINCTSETMNLVVGDVVGVTHSTPGWTAKPFQVEEVTLNYDGTTILSLIEYDSNLYAYDLSSEETSYADTDLPDPATVEPPTNLRATGTTRLQDDGSVVPALLIEWDEADDAFVDLYEVQWKPQADAQYQSAQTGQTQYEVLTLRENVAYDIRVRSINSIGVRSDFISITSIPSGDTTPPSTPTSLTATGSYKQIAITWDNPTDTDFKHVEIYRSESLNGTYSKIAVTDSEEYIDIVLAFGETKYYRVRAVDFSGNASGFSSKASGTTTFIDSNEFTSEVEDLFSNANVKQVDVVSTLSFTGEYLGQVVFYTGDNKLYRWTGSSWTAAVPAVDITGQLTDDQLEQIAAAKLTGQITETQISNNAISTPKLATGAVSANKIEAGAIVSDKIDANAVTAVKIQAGAVNADKIAGNTITGDKIVANTITGGLLSTAGIITTAAQIENGVIENAAIANAAITTAKIASANVDTLQIAGNAVIPTQFSVDSGNATFSSTNQTVLSDTVSIPANIGNARIVIMAVVEYAPTTTTARTIRQQLFADSTLHTGNGLTVAGNGVHGVIFGSFTIPANQSRTISLRIACTSGTKNVGYNAKMVIMSAKR